MTHLLRFVLMMIGLAFLAVAPLTAQKQLQGSIYSYHDGRILVGAKVYIKGFEQNTVLSDAEGNFAINIPTEIPQNARFKLYVLPQDEIYPTIVNLYNDQIKFIKVPVTQVIAANVPTKKEVVLAAANVTNPPLTAALPPAEKLRRDTTYMPVPGTLAAVQLLPKTGKVKKMQSQGLAAITNINALNVDRNQPTNAETLKKDISSLTEKLEDEQRKMIDRNQRIANEIREISRKLQDTPDISDEERNFLIDQIRKLEQQLEANNLAFKQAQAIARTEIDSMKDNLDKTNAFLKQSQRIIYGLAAVLLLFLIVGYILYLIARRRKAQRDELIAKNQEIEAQKRILEQQKQEIEASKRAVEDTNSQLQHTMQELEEVYLKVRDSIRYAQKIQEAILPVIRKGKLGWIAGQFVYYQPKDIVSGDFYWESRVQAEGKFYHFIAVVDCTGHGVPGAFMSLIGYSLLNELVNEQKIYDPSEILSELHARVFTRLKQYNVDANNDGMDLCLLRIEDRNEQPVAVFAGAKRPLILVREHKAQVFKGTRRSIGGMVIEGKDFANEEFILEPSDMIYLTTDGYVDTPNLERKNYGTQKLLYFLENIAHLPVEEQRDALIRELYIHTTSEAGKPASQPRSIQDAQQRISDRTRDDITIIGIMIGHSR
ncbi:PP2C family protein-serine/threonine phosphatase [Eisenibacter elegans]|uniref:PP2C family protein-serine/threonine phosphatase n=1 Tax=Eisenibacter elegans TaxID=997 RepID=UPI000428229A|nr:SpoIIE family protein phosphatase [Eisenibacter elegans]